MTPAQHVRESLAESRALGESFSIAWEHATISIPTGISEITRWRRALLWARPFFEAAYFGDAVIGEGMAGGWTEHRDRIPTPAAA